MYFDLFYSTFMSPNNLYHAMRDRFPDITLTSVKDWLDKQPLYQIHKDTKSGHAHFYVDKPNFLHQMDLLFMPECNGYKYILAVVDTASRFKCALPLKNKKIGPASEKIYSDGPLVWPTQVNCDSGSEFKSVANLMKRHDVKMNFAPVGYHNSQAMVERFNKEIAQRLFKYMEWHDTWNWIEPLQAMVDQLNDEVNGSIKLRPVDAILLDSATKKI